jgi:phosphosulfolactate synthase (CoM biosynthesis protein A)
MASSSVERERIEHLIGRGGLESAARACLEAGVEMIMIESEGITESVGRDHSQIVQLECLRSGVWGTKSSWGRIVTYREPPAAPAQTARRDR